MKTNLRKFLAMAALVLPIAFTACNKDKDKVEPEPQINEMTHVKLSFEADTNGATKVDLAKAASVKVEYTVNDGSVQPLAINQVDLILKGDSAKVSTFDTRTLVFKGGSSMSIHSVTFIGRDGEDLKSSPVSDTFEVTSPKGVKTMERTYRVSPLER